MTFGLVTPPARMTSAIGACGRELGPRVGAYGVAAIADDIDAVRAALGVERLDLWGNSYASYVMTVYAGRHPERVRSIVLSGAYPIAYDVFGLDKLAAARRAVGLMCARTKSCSGRAVLRDVARVAARCGAIRCPSRRVPGTGASVCASTTARWLRCCGAAGTRCS